MIHIKPFVKLTHEPHSGICCCSHSSDIASFDNIDIGISETISFAETQVFLNRFLIECHEGVRGIEADSVGELVSEVW